MKRPARFRPSLEQLESRWCPSVSASASNGILTVTGAATNVGDTIAVKETAANTFEVDDGATVVSGSPFSNISTVKIKLTKADDKVSVDLMSNTLTGDLYVNLGDGTNTATIANGTIGDELSVKGGSGTDTVNLNALIVVKDTYVNLDGGANDVLNTTGAALEGYLSTYYVNNITLDAASSVGKSFYIAGGNAGNAIDVEGKVGNSIDYDAPFYAGNLQTSSSLKLGSTASVGRNVSFFNSFFYNGNSSSLTTAVGSTIKGSVYYEGSGKGDTVDLAGSIGKNAYLDMGSGKNTLTLEGSASIAGELEAYFGNSANTVTVNKGAIIGTEAEFYFGNGANKFTFDGSAGASGSTATNLTVIAGRGNNTVTILGDAVINGDAKVKLGSGVNLLDLRDAATITGTLTAKGGGNSASKFHGSVQPNHQLLAISGFGIVDNSANP